MSDLSHDNPGVQGLAQLGRNAIERVSELEAELARERETNAVLRRDLADPPPDVQELALKRCGHFEIVAGLRTELAAAVAERDSALTEIERLNQWFESGCPTCRSVDQFTMLCEVEGCRRHASCGWPDGEEYRQTCGEHM